MVGIAGSTGDLTALQARLAGGIVTAVVAAMLVAPRGSWIYLIVLSATLFAALHKSGWRFNQIAWPTSIGVAMLGFGALAILSLSWAVFPAMAIRSGGALMLQTGLAIVAADSVARLPEATVRRLGEGMLLGFAVGIAFVVFEGLTGLSLHRLVYYSFPGLTPGPDSDLQLEPGAAVDFSNVQLKRNMAEAALLFWPLLLLSRRLLPERYVLPAILAIIASSLAAARISNHDSSILALAVSTAAFGLARIAFIAGWWTVAAGWCAVNLFIVPLMLWEFQARAYQLSWLQMSAQARLVIWGYSAQQVLKAPLLGIGAGSGGALFSRQTSFDLAPGSHYPLTTANHQHDIFLQTWYELGGIGAVALCAAGLVALWRLRRLPVPVRTYGLATFAAAMGMVSTSYGLWQEWFEASIAISAIALVLAIRLASPDAFEFGELRRVEN
jgi:hypothetical protein